MKAAGSLSADQWRKRSDRRSLNIQKQVRDENHRHADKEHDSKLN